MNALVLMIASAAVAQPPTDVTPREWTLDRLWTETAVVNGEVDRHNIRKQTFADEALVVGHVVKYEKKADLIAFLAGLVETPAAYGRVRTVNPYNQDSYAAYYDADGRRVGAVLKQKLAALQAEEVAIPEAETKLDARLAALDKLKRDEGLVKQLKEYEEKVNQARGKIPSGDRVFIDESAGNLPISTVNEYRGPLQNGQPVSPNGYIYTNPTPTPTVTPTNSQPTLYLPGPGPRAGLFRRSGDRQPLFQGGLLGGNQDGDRQRLLFTGDGRALRLGALALSITGAAIGASSGGGGGGGFVGGAAGTGTMGRSPRAMIDERFGR